jgi:integrase
MLPNQNILDQVSQKIKQFSNRRGEYLRKIHYGCFLLGYKSGLRISEAINFDLTNKTKNGLYRITKTKGQQERLVYVPKEVIQELKKSD